MKKQRKPKEYMCIDGDMHIVDRGQFIKVNDYQDLLRRYKKLLKLAHINGVFGSIKPTRKKVQRIFGDVDEIDRTVARAA